MFVNTSSPVKANKLYHKAPRKLPSDNRIPKHAQILCDLGLSKYPLSNIKQLNHRIKVWCNEIESLEKDPAYKQLFGKASLSFKEIDWLASLTEKPRHEPKGFDTFSHVLHCTPYINEIFRSAKSQSLRLEKKINAHRSYIDLKIFKITSRNHYALQLISGEIHCTPFSKPLREAKILLEPALLKGRNIKQMETRRSLKQLCKLFKDVLEFQHNQVYKKSLGGSFSGISSDWDLLKETIKYAQALNNACPDKQHTHHLISNWSNEKEHLFAASKKAATIHKQLNKLRRLPTMINSKYKTPIGSLVANANANAKKIEKSLNKLSTHIKNNKLAPNDILKLS